MCFFIDDLCLLNIFLVKLMTYNIKAEEWIKTNIVPYNFSYIL